jgi:hypothetical protein
MVEPTEKLNDVPNAASSPRYDSKGFLLNGVKVLPDYTALKRKIAYNRRHEKRRTFQDLV